VTVDERFRTHLKGLNYCLQQIVRKLLLAKEDLSAIIERFQEFTQYDDVRYFTMKCAVQVIKASTNVSNSDLRLEMSVAFLILVF
jgi:hypothetical protein